MPSRDYLVDTTELSLFPHVRFGLVAAILVSTGMFHLRLNGQAVLLNDLEEFFLVIADSGRGKNRGSARTSATGRNPLGRWTSIGTLSELIAILFFPSIHCRNGSKGGFGVAPYCFGELHASVKLKDGKITKKGQPG